MKITAYLLVQNLGTGLYKSTGRCLGELLRNSARACMPDPKRWDPKFAKIEAFLAYYPLARGQAFTWLDHGRGMTDPDSDRYFNYLGTPIKKLLEDLKGSLGDSQKGIGRLAALALNAKCRDEDVLVRIKNGFYLFSRTSRTGKVRFVPFVPEKIECEGTVKTDQFLDPDSTEMGPLKGIKGSFTAIVIPNPVFENHGQVYEAIKWFLPREDDKMFELLVGPYGSGKRVSPPPLEKDVNVTSKDGCYRARLGVCKLDEDGDDGGRGVWLCDAETGLRVANCYAMGSRLIPDPLWFPDLSGDIFIPNLLRHQDTARDSLVKEFTRPKNKEWEKAKMFLVEVAPAANALIERDTIRGDAVDTLDELAEMFNDRFGEPEEDDDGIVVPPEPGPDKPPKPAVPREKPEGGGGGGGGENKHRRRYRTIKVRDKVYKLYYGRILEDYIFAQPSYSNPQVIELNVRGGYKPLPKNKFERREHCLMQVLIAIGRSELRTGTVEQQVRFANEVRHLLK